VLELLRVIVPENTRLNVRLPGELTVAHANAAQIRQVVMNLVLNACEAIGEKNGVITIAARRERLAGPHGGTSRAGLPDGDYICLEVSDNGRGMAEETRVRIFDPFFSTKTAGRGLGLAAVQGIVRSHGGAIDVKSIAGKGATFQVLLPCNGTASESRPSASPSPDAFDERKASILVVEDEETLRLSVSRILRKRGFSVLEAGDGNLAVNLIRAPKENIAVVLLDLNLPGKSSYEVMAELRRVRPGVKVILTSAYGQDSLSASLEGVEEKSFIRKPYHLSELVSKIRHALPADPVPKCVQSGGA
jgi:CheY-like chemotaxis protein